MAEKNLDMFASTPDRDITVVLSLTFKESELREWAGDYRLGDRLNAEFRKAAESVGGSCDDNVYDLLKNL